MRTTCWLLLSLWLLGWGLPARAQAWFSYSTDFKRLAQESKKPSSPLNYGALRRRFTAHDSTLTTAELLTAQIGHTQQPGYHPYGDLDVERALYDLNAQQHYRAALELANSFQRRNPFSLLLNLEKAYALNKTGQPDSARIYYGLYLRLIKTLLASGDGSEENPFFVLSPIDGQTLITRFWQGKLGIMGSALDKKKNMLDMLEMQNSRQQPNKTYYFCIQHAVGDILK